MYVCMCLCMTSNVRWIHASCARYTLCIYVYIYVCIYIYVCMYVCMYVYIYIYIYIYIHGAKCKMDTRMHVCQLGQVYTMYVCMYVCMYTQLTASPCPMYCIRFSSLSHRSMAFILYFEFPCHICNLQHHVCHVYERLTFVISNV
jgi:hypothetical protein